MFILINILIKELISQNNTGKLLALKSNDSYLITYNYVSIKYVHQINWLKKNCAVYYMTAQVALIITATITIT